MTVLGGYYYYCTKYEVRSKKGERSSSGSTLTWGTDFSAMCDVMAVVSKVQARYPCIWYFTSILP